MRRDLIAVATVVLTAALVCPIVAQPSGQADTVVITPGLSLFLEPNAPNPFKGATQIAYTLNVETPVTLRIHDFFYNEVAVLVEEPSQMPGRYVITFDPKGTLSSGMYFYALTTRDGTLINRMLYVR